MVANEEMYQEFIIELYKHPLNFGKLEGADYRAQVDNPTCGDRIELFINVRDGVVADVKFSGQGCAISQASASLFTDYLKGKKLESLGKINRNDILGLIKIDLSRNPTRMRCAVLPLDAMKRALKK